MILKNCRLVPELCEGAKLEMADIRIEGANIAEILPAGGDYIGEEVIDCTGKTVLPGLHNLHTHLWFFGISEKDKLAYKMENDPASLTTRSIHYMYTLLSYGYTSLRDVGAAYNVSIHLKKRINSGKLLGPNLKACGYILTPDLVSPYGGELDIPCYSSNYGMPIYSSRDAYAVARKSLVEGADFIKILGDVVSPSNRKKGSILYPEALKALQDVANRENTYIAVHTTSAESAQVALEMDCHTIEHGRDMNQENIDTFVSRGLKTNLIPTLTPLYSILGVEMFRPMIIRCRDAYDAGVLIGWGSDASEDVFLEMPEREFVARELALGFDKVNILKQATINSAKINGDEEIRGTIKVGKRADLAIFDGKPDEDFSVFGKPCAYVLKDGEIVAQRGMIKL